MDDATTALGEYISLSVFSRSTLLGIILRPPNEVRGWTSIRYFRDPFELEASISIVLAMY